MHLKTCLTPLAIEEMQIKTSIKGQVCSSVVGSCLARPWAPTPAFQNKNKNSWVLTQACIHSYSGGSNQEDHTSKPAWANSWWGPISKKPNTKKDWWSGSRCRLEFKPQYCKKKKKEKKEERNHSLFLSAPCNFENTAAICLYLSRSLPSNCTLR
jgi:hypothetical protein